MGFHGDRVHSWQTWKSTPAKVEGTSTPSRVLSERLGSGFPRFRIPSSVQWGGNRSLPTRAQHAEREHDDFGTIVTEVITITAIRKRIELKALEVLSHCQGLWNVPLFIS